MPKWRRKRFQRRRRRNFWEHPDAMLYFDEFLRWKSTQKNYRIILVKDGGNIITVGLPCIIGAWIYRKPHIRKFRDMKAFTYNIAKQIRIKIDSFDKHSEGTNG